MTHRGQQRVAGLHLIANTAPYTATADDAPLDIAQRAPERRRGTPVEPEARFGAGQHEPDLPIATWTARTYAAPQPEIAVRVPLTRRPRSVWRVVSTVAAIALVLLAIAGAVAVMNAVLPGAWW